MYIRYFGCVQSHQRNLQSLQKMGCAIPSFEMMRVVTSSDHMGKLVRGASTDEQ
jgi:hypothetical protein